MNALKLQIVVHAGLIPGQPNEELTRAWHYTSQDYEHDQTAKPEDQRFSKIQDEAFGYARALQDPLRLNWVLVDWTWM